MKLFKIIGLILVLSPLGQAFGADAGASPLKLKEIVAKRLAGNIDEMDEINITNKLKLR